MTFDLSQQIYKKIILNVQITLKKSQNISILFTPFHPNAPFSIHLIAQTPSLILTTLYTHLISDRGIIFRRRRRQIPIATVTWIQWIHISYFFKE